MARPPGQRHGVLCGFPFRAELCSCVRCTAAAATPLGGAVVFPPAREEGGDEPAQGAGATDPHVIVISLSFHYHFIS